MLSDTADRAEPPADTASGLTSEATADVEPCHVDPPHGVTPDSQATGPPVSAPAPVADFLLTVKELSPHGGVLPLPGEPLNGFGLAAYRTGAAALAALCVLRT